MDAAPSIVSTPFALIVIVFVLAAPDVSLIAKGNPFLVAAAGRLIATAPAKFTNRKASAATGT